MFDFLKNIFQPKQEPPKPALQFGGGMDDRYVEEYFEDVWNEVLSESPTKNLPADVLSEVKAICKEALSSGAASQKIATRLRPTFEAHGLKRKDALFLVSEIVNRSYKQLKENLKIDVNFIMKDGTVEDAETFVANAIREENTKATNKKGCGLK